MSWFDEKYYYKGFCILRDDAKSGFVIHKDGERITDMQMGSVQGAKNVLNTYLNSIGLGEYPNYKLPWVEKKEETIQHHFKK